MGNEKKSSIIKEALIDYNALKEAADANAKKKLADEFPEKFNKLLKEELNNKKQKESYKKIEDDAKESEELDEIELKNESDMNNQVKETAKVTNTVGKGKPFETKPKNTKSVEEDVKITDTVGKSEPFDEKAKGVQKIEEEREKDFVGDVEGDTPNLAKGETGKGIAFKEKIKSKEKPISNLKEEFDISELDISSVGSALEGAEEDDEFAVDDEGEDNFNISDIDSEITEMESLGDKLDDTEQGGDTVSELIEMRNKLDDMIKSLGGEEEGFEDEEGVETDSENEFPENAEDDEMFTDSTEEMDEENVITDDDINTVLGNSPEKEIGEAKGISFSDGTITPGKLGDHPGTHGRFRQEQNESKRHNALIEENKKLTKKLNESKKFKQSVTTLVENYKSALEKYRNQLKEMAIFNTNLAHVNNLLVNESLALTQDDKIKIINEFKTVDSITESQKKYKSFITEMKGNKKTISESIDETKVSASIQPSSKQKLDEVVEKTAYADDAHLNRMKKIIETIEKRGKKIIK